VNNPLNLSVIQRSNGFQLVHHAVGVGRATSATVKSSFEKRPIHHTPP
jgi:hypothetical protein